MCLYVSLHLLKRCNEVVIPSINLEVQSLGNHFLNEKKYFVLPPGPGGVRDAGPKPLRKFSHEVVVYSVFHWAQNYDRSGKLQVYNDVLKFKSQDLLKTNQFPRQARKLIYGSPVLRPPDFLKTH